MLESSAFKVIEDLAEERRARHIVRKLGEAKFGAPSDDQAAKLAVIDNLTRLDRLAVRVLSVHSWDELLKGR